VYILSNPIFPRVDFIGAYRVCSHSFFLWMFIATILLRLASYWQHLAFRWRKAAFAALVIAVATSASDFISILAGYVAWALSIIAATRLLHFDVPGDKTSPLVYLPVVLIVIVSRTLIEKLVLKKAIHFQLTRRQTLLLLLMNAITITGVLFAIFRYCLPSHPAIA
jgi:hypothetical protein